MINGYKFNTKINFILSFKTKELKHLNKITSLVIINLVVNDLLYQFKLIVMR